MTGVAEIMHEALDLPRTDRAYLAKKLIESLEMDDAFTDEEMRIFTRRSREIRDATVTPLTLEQLRQNVTAKLA